MTTDPTTIPDATQIALARDRDRLNQVEATILEEIDRHEYPKNARFAIRLALEEAVTNAFEHGGDGGNAVVIEYAVHPKEICIAVDDGGPGFDPEQVADPTLDENLDKPGGRGLMLMRAYMTEVVHNARGNRVLMRYRRPASNGG